jgi:hypothetical protein
MSHQSAKSYAEQLEEIVEEYRNVTGATSVDLNLVAEWAVTTGRWSPYPQDIAKLARNHFARALRSIHSHDSQGRVVRKHHAVPITTESQTTFAWYRIENMDYAEMRASAQYRRNLILNDCKQLKRDTDSWNENYSDGLLVQPNFDFTLDVLEADTPDTHPDIDSEDDEIL